MSVRCQTIAHIKLEDTEHILHVMLDSKVQNKLKVMQISPHLTVSSHEPDAMVLPFGAIATHRTSLVWPCSVLAHAFDTILHTLRQGTG